MDEETPAPRVPPGSGLDDASPDDAGPDVGARPGAVAPLPPPVPPLPLAVGPRVPPIVARPTEPRPVSLPEPMLPSQWLRSWPAMPLLAVPWPAPETRPPTSVEPEEAPTSIADAAPAAFLVPAWPVTPVWTPAGWLLPLPSTPPWSSVPTADAGIALAAAPERVDQAGSSPGSAIDWLAPEQRSPSRTSVGAVAPVAQPAAPQQEQATAPTAEPLTAEPVTTLEPTADADVVDAPDPWGTMPVSRPVRPPVRPLPPRRRRRVLWFVVAVLLGGLVAAATVAVVVG
jgi:hypothetical protein